MHKSSYVLLRLVLLSVSIAHLIIGGIACIPGMPVVKLAEIFYKASVTLNPQIEHIMQMFGAYMLLVGILAILASLDPVKNKAITHGIIILLVLRVFQRLAFAQRAWSVFHIPAGWYWAQTIFFFLIAIALFLLSPKGESST